MEQETFLCVVIPVFNEPDVIQSLNSLYNCLKPQFKVEIILVVNHAENSDKQVKEQSKQTVLELEELINAKQIVWLKAYVIQAFDLPKKKAGVGLARKIGMDEAASRFNKNQNDGIIICFDADSCCQQNYFRAIEEAFILKSENSGASIHYEHPIYDSRGQANLPIILYEIHLRYYIQALAYTGYPYAFHTIGSSMAVRSSMYQKSGGMNTRKAGEDFYFLHKIIPLGGFINITSTTITPSARESDRVPFGTGKAIKSHNSKDKLLGYTYNLSIFIELKLFFELVDKGFQQHLIPPNISAFLKEQNLISELMVLVEKATNKAHFQERFYQWFNGFKVLKCIHYLKENYYPDLEIVVAVQQLYDEDARFKQKKPSKMDSFSILSSLRAFEKDLNYTI
jgi:glycosyltransferase involved in cell wall biosynthesis